MSDLLARLRIEGDAGSLVAAGNQAEKALGGVRQQADQAGQAMDGADRQASGLGRSATTAAGAADRLDRELSGAAASAGRAATGFDRAGDRAQHLDRSASSARGAIGLLGGAMAVVGGSHFAREISDSAMAAASLTLGMGAVSGGAQNASVNLAFAADEADRLGLIAQDASKSLVNLGGSTNGTVLAGQANAHTAALVRQQSADAGLARSKSALGLAAGGAKGAMSGLLALVGGPWGAAFLAAGSAVYFLVKAHEAEEAKSRELQRALQEGRAEYEAYAAAKVALGKTTGDVITAEDQAATAAANLAGEVDKLADAHYRAAAAAQYHALEALKLKAVESRASTHIWRRRSAFPWTWKGRWTPRPGLRASPNSRLG